MAGTGSGSRNKGARYERDIAKKLSEIFGVEVKRTGAQEKWKATRGDVNTREHLQSILDEWHIETKNRESLPKTILDWYKKTQEEAEESGRTPVVFTTKNYEDDYVFLSLDDFLDILKELEEEKADQ